MRSAPRVSTGMPSLPRTALDATVLLVALHIVTLARDSATVSLVWWEPSVTAVRIGHLALNPALVAVSVIVKQQRRWFSLVTLLTGRVPVSPGLMDPTAASVLQVTGATALMAAKSVSVEEAAVTLAQESVIVLQV